MHSSGPLRVKQLLNAWVIMRYKPRYQGFVKFLAVSQKESIVRIHSLHGIFGGILSSDQLIFIKENLGNKLL